MHECMHESMYVGHTCKKDDPKLLKNYRPISLLPTISKVIEKIIFTQLSTDFNENKLIFDNQYGFRPTHST